MQQEKDLDWLADRMRLLKAGFLNTDREQVVIVTSELIDRYGSAGAKEIYQGAKVAMNDAGKKPKVWLFETLLPD